MKNKYILICLLLSILVFSCNLNSTDTGNNKSYDWQISNLEALGFCSQKLNEAVKKIAAERLLTSLLVVKNGYLVVEEYFEKMERYSPKKVILEDISFFRNGYFIAENYKTNYDKDDAHIVTSVSNNFSSALIGIAVREGFINTDDKVMRYLCSSYKEKCKCDKSKITIEQLLTMRSGIAKDSKISKKVFSSNNWVKTLLDIPLDCKPGKQFNHSLPAGHLLSAILTKATGMSTLEFAQKHLFDPLKISINRWNVDPQGLYIGSCSMYFTPRDLARFGYLFLNKGNLDGIQIIPEDWIEKSFGRYTKFEKDWGSISHLGYGYSWWSGSINGYKTYFAVGHGGQFIFILPKLCSVIVTTSNANIDYKEADKKGQKITDFIAKTIIPTLNK
jgi:CubicO group peptidase (beta-lactamase class C family)